jgi:ATP-dependent helicase/nuclease subunit B
MQDAARRLEAAEMEPERWADLAKFERRCIDAANAAGYGDWQAARRRAAAQGLPPELVKRIAVIGVLDPTPLAVEALRRWCTHVPVDVLVYAPSSSHAFAFDEWGRPVVDFWLNAPIILPVPEARIQQGGTPGEQADVAVELLERYESPGSSAALGVADAEVTAPLEKALAARDIGAFNPAGRPMGLHGVVHLLKLLSQLTSQAAFHTAAEMLRCPDMAETALRMHIESGGEASNFQRLLDDLDTVAVKALPDTLEDAIMLAKSALGLKFDTSPLPPALHFLAETLKVLDSEQFSAGLTGFLSDVFAERKFHSSNPQDAVFAAIADQISEVLDAFDGPAARMIPSGLTAAGKLELMLKVLEEQVFYPERTARDIDLQGWLELLWEDAPHLILTGKNDGKAPESIHGHHFLPDAARRVLGLRHNDSRYARDACLLTSLIQPRERRPDGRVDFVFGRLSASNAPLRPSRLLFQCEEAELPQRTLMIFQRPSRRHDPMPWQLAWKLKPEALADNARIFTRISVTAIRDYLACPFRFYLRHGKKMEEVDAARSEMDAREFGNLVHHVLEKFAKEGTARESLDAEVIRAEFHAILDRYLHAVYGPELTVPVLIQRESARQRFSWWAELEAEQRKQGWRIADAETAISPEGDPWMIGAMVISGTVDRVERHSQYGIRLIDFKTYSPYGAQKRERKTVEEYHLTPLKRTEDSADFPDWSLSYNSAGKLCRWTDLQLPLYRLAMERRYPDTPLSTAYVTLGKTKADLALDPWPALTGPLLQSARRCAEGVLAAVLARKFWPPAQVSRYPDAVDTLFFGDVLSAVDPSSLLAAER